MSTQGGQMDFGFPLCSIGDVATSVCRPETPVPGTEYRQIGVRLWGAGAYERESIDGSETKYAQLNRVEAGDIIVNKIWARNGSVSVVSPQLAGCVCSGEFPLFRPYTDRLLPEWFYWITKTRWFWHRCDVQSQGTSGKNRIRPEKFLQITIPIPPVDEQRRIVDRIAHFEDRLTNVTQIRREAHERRDHLIGALTSEICDSLGGVPHIAIGELGQGGCNPVQTGPFGAQLHRSEFTEDGVPVLNVGNVWPEGLRLDYVDHVSPEKAIQLSRYSIKTDDLLFARSGATLGKVCVVPQNCDGWLMTGHLFRVRFDQSRCLPAFAFAVLRGSRKARDQIFGQVRGATRPGFNTTLLSRVEIPLPSLEQQRLIIARLEQLSASLDQVRNLHKRTSAEFDALLPSILDRAFQGQL